MLCCDCCQARMQKHLLFYYFPLENKHFSASGRMSKTHMHAHTHTHMNTCTDFQFWNSGKKWLSTIQVDLQTLWKILTGWSHKQIIFHTNKSFLKIEEKDSHVTPSNMWRSQFLQALYQCENSSVYYSFTLNNTLWWKI